MRLHTSCATVGRNLSCASLLLLPLSAHAQQARAIVSPDVLPDGRVTFRLNAPKADEVMLSGEFLDKPRSFTRDADGVWSVTVGPIAPEVYHYNFTIDGVRTIDPSNPQLKTGSTASTITSVLEIRHPSPAFYDAQPVPHGDIRTHWYHSKSLDSVRRLTVYTPPGYDKDRSARYPVLYLFHGANADENAWYRLGRANLILDNLLATGKIQPFIVVMPFGYGVPPNGPQAENTAKFGKDLIEDVIPYIESNYRAHTDRDRRAIVGLSMGGGQALSIGLNNIPLFSYVGGFSCSHRKCRELSEDVRQARRQCQRSEREAEAAVGRLRHRGFAVRRVEELFRVSERQQNQAHVPGNRRRSHVDGLAPISQRDLSAVVSR